MAASLKRSREDSSEGEPPLKRSRLSNVQPTPATAPKSEAKEASYFSIYGENAELEIEVNKAAIKERRQKFLFESDFHGLILYLLTDTICPKWLFVKNKSLLSKIFIIQIDFLNEKLIEAILEAHHDMTILPTHEQNEALDEADVAATFPFFQSKHYFPLQIDIPKFDTDNVSNGPHHRNNNYNNNYNNRHNNNFNNFNNHNNQRSRNFNNYNNNRNYSNNSHGSNNFRNNTIYTRNNSNGSHNNRNNQFHTHHSNNNNYNNYSNNHHNNNNYFHRNHSKHLCFRKLSIVNPRRVKGLSDAMKEKSKMSAVKSDENTQNHPNSSETAQNGSDPSNAASESNSSNSSNSNETQTPNNSNNNHNNSSSRSSSSSEMNGIKAEAGDESKCLEKKEKDEANGMNAEKSFQIPMPTVRSNIKKIEEKMNNINNNGPICKYNWDPSLFLPNWTTLTKHGYPVPFDEKFKSYFRFPPPPTKFSFLPFYLFVCVCLFAFVWHAWICLCKDNENVQGYTILFFIFVFLFFFVCFFQ